MATTAALVSVPSCPPQRIPRLPVEIIRQIIESTACPFRKEYYCDFQASQATLRRLCLVSRIFRQIALPLRDRIIHVMYFAVWKEKFDRQDDTRAFESRVREFTCAGGARWKTLEPTVRHFEHLHTLAVDRMQGIIDWADLEHLKHLSCLSVSLSPIRASRPFTLPRLVDLTLETYGHPAPWTRDTHCHFAPCTFDRSTTALAFPYLRILAYKLNEGHSAPLLRALFDAVSSQPDGALLDCDALNSLDPALVAPMRPKTLVNMIPEQLDKLGSVAAAQVIDIDPFSVLDDVSLVDSAISKLRLSSSLSLLYFSEILSPEQRWEPKFNKARDDLLQRCRDRKIEVVFLNTDRLSGFDPVMPSDYIERVQGRRAAE